MCDTTFNTTKAFDEYRDRLQANEKSLSCADYQILRLVRALDYFRNKCDGLVTDVCPKDEDFERCTGMRCGDCLLTEALLQ